MLFNSGQYLYFYLFILGLSWFLVGMPRVRTWLILLASFYFYASNNGWLILLLFVCMQIDYMAAKIIEDSPTEVHRRFFLGLSMTTNLCMLGFFKYFNFFAGIATSSHWVPWNIALPVGISFYTFESMSYTIDVFRREIPAERSWYRFAFFVAYFPHLIAGPILRPKQFLPQIDKKPRLSIPEFEAAIYDIAKGLFKKVVLADYLSLYADRVFEHPESHGSMSAWIGVFAFTFQIYYDFSGYTDVAMGCARLMGFVLPDNFNRPYVSASITEFWKRWHISLSSWLKDYLYIPLGGNRVKNKLFVYRNLIITMLLGGLWHGAAWHFVIWGLVHGLFLSVERMFGWETVISDGAKFNPIFIFRRLGMIFILTFTWIIFRAENDHLLRLVFLKLFNWERSDVLHNGEWIASLIVLIGWLFQLISERFPTHERFSRLPIPLKGLAYAAVGAAVLVCNSEGAKTFIYFKF
jgi:alginate O-acetyltransferase complex protein AlgI